MTYLDPILQERLETKLVKLNRLYNLLRETLKGPWIFI